jgi:integrase
MALPKRFPHRVQVGNVSVTIYRNRVDADAKYESFIVADLLTGKRRRQRFPNYEQALAEAQRLALSLSRQDTAAGAVDFKDAATLIRARELLKGLDIPLESAVDLFVKAARLVGPHRVLEAAIEHARLHPVSMERVPLATAADKYFDTLRERGASERHLVDVRTRIGRLLHDHPGRQLHELTTSQLQTWIDGLQKRDGQSLSAISKRNFATVVGGFFEHWRRRGFISTNPAADLDRPRMRKSEDVLFWTPDEATRLLDAIEPAAKASLAVALFAGVRSAELVRLKRSDFQLDSLHLALGGTRTKTRSRRLTPIPANLLAWLKAARFHDASPTQPLWDKTAEQFYRQVTEACVTAGVRRLANGARHSCITYKVALTGDVARVSLESGNSPQVVDTAYRGLATESDARAYFAIFPRTDRSPATAAE